MGVNSLYCLAKLPISRADGGLQGSTFPLDALTLVNVRIQRTLGFRPQLGCLSIHNRAAQYAFSIFVVWDSQTRKWVKMLHEIPIAVNYYNITEN